MDLLRERERTQKQLRNARSDKQTQTDRETDKDGQGSENIQEEMQEKVQGEHIVLMEGVLIAVHLLKGVRVARDELVMMSRGHQHFRILVQHPSPLPKHIASRLLHCSKALVEVRCFFLLMMGFFMVLVAD